MNQISIEYFTREEISSVRDWLDSLSSGSSYYERTRMVVDAADVFSMEIPDAAIIIWDLDSFEICGSLFFLKKIKEKNSTTQIAVYGKDLEKYKEIPERFFDKKIKTENIKVELPRCINDLKDTYIALNKFQQKMRHLIGESEAMKCLKKEVRQAIRPDAPVLILGETGVGKELVARAISCIYDDDKFVTVNCSAIPDNLIESELFGHTRGAFTGAHIDRKGLFEEANGGVIFLDEIGDMPLHTQVKLLRVLQNKEILRLGENKPTPIDVRVIAATNRNLLNDIAQKKFREDLYYRLNVIPINIPPLRERKEDISALADYFIKNYQRRGENFILSEAALVKLKNHNWPGNIRELENVIQRSLCFAANNILRPEDIRIDNTIEVFLQKETPKKDYYQITYEDFKKQQEAEEIDFFKMSIKQWGSASKAASQLKMNRTYFYNRLKSLGIDIKDFKNF